MEEEDALHPDQAQTPNAAAAPRPPQKQRGIAAMLAGAVDDDNDGVWVGGGFGAPIGACGMVGGGPYGRRHEGDGENGRAHRHTLGSSCMQMRVTSN